MRHQKDWVTQVVRLLIGLPMAVAYFYVRHFSMDAAYGLLSAGLLIMAIGLQIPWPVKGLADRRVGGSASDFFSSSPTVVGGGSTGRS